MAEKKNYYEILGVSKTASEEDKAPLQSAVDEAKKALESDDEETYKKAFETLTNAIQPVIAKMYQQANGGAGAPGGAPDGGEEFHQ